MKGSNSLPFTFAIIVPAALRISTEFRVWCLFITAFKTRSNSPRRSCTTWCRPSWFSEKSKGETTLKQWINTQSHYKPLWWYSAALNSRPYGSQACLDKEIVKKSYTSISQQFTCNVVCHLHINTFLPKSQASILFLKKKRLYTNTLGFLN